VTRTPTAHAGLAMLAIAALLVTSSGAGEPPASGAAELAGLWVAKQRFGPDARGPLMVTRVGGAYVAEIVGKRVPVRESAGVLSFELPAQQGGFRGRLASDGRIRGEWLRPGTPVNGYSASPVALSADQTSNVDQTRRWRGAVDPLQDDFTMYLLAQPRADGSLAVVLRNPERDWGTQIGARRLLRDGNRLQLMGARGDQPERELARGSYDPESQVITLTLRGGSYDFTRAGDASDFYPRGREPGRYAYLPPPALDDGWPVGTLDRADVSRAGIENLVQRFLDMPMDSPDAPQIHALLLARRGKLVLEEYFHGFHRNQLHNTRSAGKSVAATAIGAAMQAGAPLRLDSPVYQVMNGGVAPAGIEPRKRAMTLEHLLTMSAGWYCDDTDDKAPGNEETIDEQQEEPDWYRYTLAVPMATTPGERAVYCSCQPNVALGMVGRATGESAVAAFDRWVAEPLQIRRYAWPLDPARQPYGGGGVALLVRDFLKFGQLMLDGGRWQGQQVLSPQFVRQAMSPQYHLRNNLYGYLWWIDDVPYQDRKVRVVSARGAGGQWVAIVPELELVVGIMGGNYSSRVQLTYTGNLVPRSILPAVREPGDDPAAPVVDRGFTSAYGPSPDGSRVSPERP
jgi:CubicO group peptidase (beta-lactamase class C family)